MPQNVIHLKREKDGHNSNIILNVLKTLPPDVGSLSDCVSERHCQIACFANFFALLD